MYYARPVARSPSVCRIVSNAPRRNASFFPGFPVQSLSAPFFGRAAGHDPFRALDRMLEDFSSPNFPFAPQQLLREQSSAPTFQPRFDVRENDGTYELRGEMPGVESEDLEVEFSDAQTLIVRGRTERESSSGTQPEKIQNAKGKERITNYNPDGTDKAVASEAVTSESQPAVDNSDTASVHSTGSYQKPTVEDAEAPETASEAVATPATTPGEASTEQQVATQAQPRTEPQQTEQQQTPRYWVSERSVGTFQRVFNFPEKVDQAAVTASLKNGILNIVVPKAVAPQPRKIQVE